MDQIIGSYLETFPNLRVLKARFEDNHFSTLQANLSKLTDLDMDLRNAYETISIAHIEGLVNNNTQLTALTLRVRTDKLLPSKILSTSVILNAWILPAILSRLYEVDQFKATLTC